LSETAVIEVHAVGLNALLDLRQVFQNGSSAGLMQLWKHASESVFVLLYLESAPVFVLLYVFQNGSSAGLVQLCTQASASVFVLLY
jgi:hypothetical protein